MDKRDRVLWFLAFAGAAAAGASAYGRFAVRRYENLTPETAGAPGKFIDVDGVPIHYVEIGSGEPVVLIHGLNASTFTYREIMPELSRRFRVVALDLKGFGYSGRPEGADYSLTAQAELVARFMARLGIERAAVVGHSMGGAVAMRLAIRAPDLVTRLVLVDSATDHELDRGLRSAVLVRPFLPLVAGFALRSVTVRRRALLTAVHDPAFLTPELLQAYMRPGRMRGRMRALGELLVDRRRDGPIEVERISQPTLILWGEFDRWLPPSRGEELARRIADARLVLIQSSGHLALEEQPYLCNRALLEFLERSTASEPQPLEQPGATLETPT